MVDWRRVALWLLAGGIISCGWCTLFSGISGWLMGYDLGQREARMSLLPDTGVLVTRVERGGPADLAGIERGNIIIAINGVMIADVPMLQAELMRYEPGQQVQITFRDHTTERITTVVLGYFPGSNTSLPYLGIYYTARAENPADA